MNHIPHMWLRVSAARIEHERKCKTKAFFPLMSTALSCLLSGPNGMPGGRRKPTTAIAAKLDDVEVRWLWP